MFDDLETHALHARAGGLGGPDGRPPVFKAVGIALAVASGLFIGVSFVLKKVGLLKANEKYNEEAGEGYGYLRNAYWWGGMTLMIVGEICNFVAYAFVDAILVTPLGALSVVVCTVLSAIFLKERLSFVGKVGCFACIIGSVIIAMHAPAQSAVANIQEMKDYVVSPGFLTYAGVIIVACVIIAVWAGPRYGKQNMFVYITICSLIGGLSVVATQGLGAAIIAMISGEPQYKEWFLWVLLVFVITTLLTEIIYLNKALNIFNAALVTPTYYVVFTSATIITSAVLFQGFRGTAVGITTIVMGFLQICCGVVLLQLSRSAKDVPDTAVFKGDLDQVREVAEQEQPESEPKADTIRGAASIIRRLSTPRHNMEVDEARRVHAEKRLDEVSEPGDNEAIQWDGLRRRRTTFGESSVMTSPRRMKTVHPPLGMSRFPDYNESSEHSSQRAPSTRRSRNNSALGSILSRESRSNLHPHWRPSHSPPLEEKSEENAQGQGQGLLEPFHYSSKAKSGTARDRSDTNRSVSWADEIKGHHDGGVRSLTSSNPPTPPPHGEASREFSFQNIFHPRSHQRQPPSRQKTPDHDASKRARQEGRTLGFPSLPSPFGRRRANTRGGGGSEEESLGLVIPGNQGRPEQEAEQHEKDGFASYRRAASVSSLTSSTSSASEHDDEKHDPNYSDPLSSQYSSTNRPISSHATATQQQRQQHTGGADTRHFEPNPLANSPRPYTAPSPHQGTGTQARERTHLPQSASSGDIPSNNPRDFNPNARRG